MKRPERRAVRPRTQRTEPGYWQWSTAPIDPSRRRFLRQIAVGSGAVGLAASTRLAIGQPAALDIDYSILEAHQPNGEPSAEASVRAPRRARIQSREEARDPGMGSVEVGEGSGGLAHGLSVAENRALWVDPAYLLLVHWTRPEGDDSPVAALEAAAPAVREYLETTVDDPQALHDVDQLTEIERGLVDLLAPRLAPAEIIVLHLDHDCSVICAPDETTVHVRGMIAPTRR